MTDPITAGARAAADQLSTEYGPELGADVEDVLQAHGERPEQYIEPISTALLIVTIAQLAWNIYHDRKNKKLNTSPDVVASEVRATFSSDTTPVPDRVIDVVVTEVIRADSGPG